MSLGDYLQDRYKSKYLKVLASCISVLMTMVFFSMQYVGNARAMSIVSGNAISYTAAIIVSILFSLMYVLIGGAGGVVLLDAIQAVIPVKSSFIPPTGAIAIHAARTIPTIRITA